MRRYAALGLVLTALIAGSGCGNPDAPAVSGSTEETTVKGTVRIRGKAVTNGEVSFRSSNINRPNVPLRTAKIDKDGTYTIQALVGENFVEVSCKEIATRKNMELIENEQPVKLKPGGVTLDISLPATGPLLPQ